ncbi:hypothetical protein GC175_23365 [bacterium]|nr:hypothetical protein [bacterium]
MCVCDNCGVSFLWTIEEQHQEEQHRIEAEVTGNADAPVFCPACRRLATPVGRERGVVKWYDGRKHYGFIVRQREDEIFTHRSQLAERGRLHEGDLVEFTVTTGEKGLMAADVRVLARGEEMSKE